MAEAAATPDPPESSGGSLFQVITGRPRPGRPAAARPAKSAKPPAPRRPAPAKQRKSMEQSLALVYGMAGSGIEMRGVRVRRPDGALVWQPSMAGRAMKLGATSAGKDLSDWVNSIGWLSAILGPVLGNESFATMARVAGLPLMLHVLQVRPEAAPLIQPLAMPLLADLWVGAKKAEAAQRAAMEGFADMDADSAAEFREWAEAIFAVDEQVIEEPDHDVAAGVDPIDDGPPGPSPPPPAATPPPVDGFPEIDAELDRVR